MDDVFVKSDSEEKSGVSMNYEVLVCYSKLQILIVSRTINTMRSFFLFLLVLKPLTSSAS